MLERLLAARIHHDVEALLARLKDVAERDAARTPETGNAPRTE